MYVYTYVPRKIVSWYSTAIIQGYLRPPIVTDSVTAHRSFEPLRFGVALCTAIGRVPKRGEGRTQDPGPRTQDPHRETGAPPLPQIPQRTRNHQLFKPSSSIHKRFVLRLSARPQKMRRIDVVLSLHLLSTIGGFLPNHHPRS